MNKLRVKCIRCGKEWEKDATFPWGPDDCSSSLCKACFIQVATPLIRKKQRLEGYFDCFAKSNGYCDQVGCKYRHWCLDTETSTAKEKDWAEQGQGPTEPHYSPSPYDAVPY